MRVRDLLNAAGRKDPASVRMLASAHASHEEMYLLKRLAEDLKGDGGASHVHVAWRRTEKQQPAEHQVPRAGDRCAERQRREGSRARRRPARAMATPTCRRCAPRSIRTASRCSTSSIRAPTDRWAISSWIVDARKSGRLPIVIYQGVLQTELVEDRRRRAARLRVGREGRDLHERPGHGAGGLEGDQRAGRIRRRLADSHQRRGGARPALHLHDLAAGARRCRQAPGGAARHTPA